MPNDISGGRALSRPISCCSARASELDRPPPPYSLGQVGAVQPLSAIRSNQSFASGFFHLARRPPQIELSSSSVTAAAAPRIEAGQLASSQLRASFRKASRSLIKVSVPWPYRAFEALVPF